MPGGRERDTRCQGYGQDDENNREGGELAELMGNSVMHFGCILAWGVWMGGVDGACCGKVERGACSFSACEMRLAAGESACFNECGGRECGGRECVLQRLWRARVRASASVAGESRQWGADGSEGEDG